MIFISQRGNVNGKDEKLENNPSHVYQLSKKYQVEIDLWVARGNLYLGHDYPVAKYKIDTSFLNKNLWIHCKNIEACDFMSKTKHNWFWHENDKMTMTSKGYIWCFPHIYLENGITVMSGMGIPSVKVKGICTDFLNHCH